MLMFLLGLCHVEYALRGALQHLFESLEYRRVWERPSVTETSTDACT